MLRPLTMPPNRPYWWGSSALLLGAALAEGCAGHAVSTPSAPARSDPPAPTLAAPRASGVASQTLTVRPVSLETLETVDFPCPHVDENDPDYLPCDGGTR
jgi:hypothetical protein